MDFRRFGRTDRATGLFLLSSPIIHSRLAAALLHEYWSLSAQHAEQSRKTRSPKLYNNSTMRWEKLGLCRVRMRIAQRRN
jgi:hypothetical protein